MLMLPYSYDNNDLKYQIAPGTWGSSGAFLEYLKSSFDVLYSEGLEGRPKMMTVGLHCRISGKPGRFAAVESFVKYIQQQQGVWITTRKDIAMHWRATFPYTRSKEQEPVPEDEFPAIRLQTAEHTVCARI
jgi:peptidoglycan/xylan/chitin deacetylase (PgdA/CDA1 family)